MHPVHWPTWIGLGLLRILALLPYRPLMAVGRWVGRLLYLFAKRRRRIAETNLRVCFPEWDEQQIQSMLKQYFVSVGMGLMDILIAWWWWPHKKIEPLCEVEGVEHLEDAFAAGKGVIFFTLHMSSIEIGGRLIAHYAPVVPFYRPNENPVLHYIAKKIRERRLGKLIPRDQVRTMVKRLRANQGIWFAPDQNYGHKHSLFVDFFGVPAATNTSTSRFAGLTKAKVVPFVVMRRPEGGYRMLIEPMLDHFPSDDVLRDTQRLNAIIERWILAAPEQYNWMHRRFKDRPNNEPRFY